MSGLKTRLQELVSKYTDMNYMIQREIKSYNRCRINILLFFKVLSKEENPFYHVLQCFSLLFFSFHLVLFLPQKIHFIMFYSAFLFFSFGSVSATENPFYHVLQCFSFLFFSFHLVLFLPQKIHFIMFYSAFLFFSFHFVLFLPQTSLILHAWLTPSNHSLKGITFFTFFFLKAMIWGFYSNSDEDLSLLGCYPMLTGK